MSAEKPRRSAAEQERLHVLLAQMFEQRITFNSVIGLKVLSLEPGDVRGAFEMKPELVGHFTYGRLHGGVTSSVLDAMGGLALMVAVGERHADESAMAVMHRFGRVGTIDLRVDFLRPGIGQRFTATADVLRLGGRVGSTQMCLLDDAGALLATAAAAYVVS